MHSSIYKYKKQFLICEKKSEKKKLFIQRLFNLLFAFGYCF